jgi:hypothetical protein
MRVGDAGVSENVHVGPPQTPQMGHADPIEVALADAIRRAAQAGEWAAVQQLARELEARRLARADVVDLNTARRRQGRRGSGPR